MKSANETELDTFQPLGMAAERVVNNLKESSELTMMNPRRVCKHGSSFLFGGERSQAFGTIADPDLGIPSTILTSIDALQSRSGTSFAISGVLLASRNAEISETVISFVAIDMIDNTGWPPSMREQPSESVLTYLDAEHSDHPISISTKVPSARARCDTLTTKPGKMANLGIVANNLRDLFEREKRFLNEQLFPRRHALELAKEHKEDSRSNPDAGNGDKRDRKEHLQEIDGRLSDGNRWAYIREGIDRIQRFEDRARGKR